MKSLNPYYKLFFLLILLISCDHSDSEIPSCIEEKINTLKNEPVQNPPAEIWEWRTNNNTYY